MSTTMSHRPTSATWVVRAIGPQGENTFMEAWLRFDPPTIATIGPHGYRSLRNEHGLWSVYPDNRCEYHKYVEGPALEELLSYIEANSVIRKLEEGSDILPRFKSNQITSEELGEIRYSCSYIQDDALIEIEASFSLESNLMKRRMRSESSLVTDGAKIQWSHENYRYDLPIPGNVLEAPEGGCILEVIETPRNCDEATLDPDADEAWLGIQDIVSQFDAAWLTGDGEALIALFKQHQYPLSINEATDSDPLLIRLFRKYGGRLGGATTRIDSVASSDAYVISQTPSTARIVSCPGCYRVKAVTEWVWAGATGRVSPFESEFTVVKAGDRYSFAHWSPSVIIGE